MLFIRHIPTAVCCCLLWAFAACSQPSEPPSAEAASGATDGSPWHPIPTRILEDPFTFVVDAAAPTQRFAGDSGSLLLGSGWGVPERSAKGDSWMTWTWATAREAELTFLAPPGPELDLLLWVRPFPYEEGGPQRVEVLLDGETQGRIQLEDGWQKVRFPLSAAAAKPGRHRLTFRFRRVTKPKDIGRSGDERPLAASFRAVVVVPRPVLAVRSFLDASRWRPESKTLELPIRGGAALPLRPGARARLRLGAVEATCDACTLDLERRGERDVETLWSGPAEDASGIEVEIETPPEAYERLWLRVTPGKRDRVDTGVSVGLGPDFLAYRKDPRRAATAGEGTRPHVFFYMVDTLRADYLEPYGAPEGTSPELTRFASEAVTYRAWAPSTWTLPSVTSVMTGVYPFRHGVMQGNVLLDPESWPTLPAYLEDNGYRTVGLSHSYVAGPAFGLDAGFGDFRLVNQLGGWGARSQEIRGYLLEWLLTGDKGAAPLMVYLHTIDPHSPYTPPPAADRWTEPTEGDPSERWVLPSRMLTQGFADKPNSPEVNHLRALYRGEIAHTDEHFGRFLDLLRMLGVYDDSMIAFLSDHGEEFAEHGGFEHGRTVYQEQVRVPLVVRYPGGREAGRAVEGRVSTLDLLPTVLALAGVEAPEATFDGIDLNDETAAGSRRRIVYSELHPAPSVRLGEVNYRTTALGAVKCIDNLLGVNQYGDPMPAELSFDLAADPGEQDPLSADDPSARNCHDALERWLAAQLVDEPVDPASERTDEEAKEALRALGYIR